MSLCFLIPESPKNKPRTKNASHVWQIGGEVPRGSAESTLGFGLSAERWVSNPTLLFRTPFSVSSPTPWTNRTLSSQGEIPNSLICFFFWFSVFTLDLIWVKFGIWCEDSNICGFWFLRVLWLLRGYLWFLDRKWESEFVWKDTCWNARICGNVGLWQLRSRGLLFYLFFNGKLK